MQSNQRGKPASVQNITQDPAAARVFPKIEIIGRINEKDPYHQHQKCQAKRGCPSRQMAGVVHLPSAPDGRICGGYLSPSSPDPALTRGEPISTSIQHSACCVSVGVYTGLRTSAPTQGGTQRMRGAGSRHDKLMVDGSMTGRPAIPISRRHTISTSIKYTVKNQWLRADNTFKAAGKATVADSSKARSKLVKSTLNFLNEGNEIVAWSASPAEMHEVLEGFKKRCVELNVDLPEMMVVDNCCQVRNDGANGLVAMHTQWLKPKLTVLFLSHVISPYIHASRLLACSSSLLNSTHPGCLMLLNTVRRLGAESSKIDEWNIAGDQEDSTLTSVPAAVPIRRTRDTAEIGESRREGAVCGRTTRGMCEISTKTGRKKRLHHLPHSAAGLSAGVMISGDILSRSNMASSMYMSASVRGQQSPAESLFVSGRKSFGGDAQEDDDAETHEMRRPQNEDGAVPIYLPYPNDAPRRRDMPARQRLPRLDSTIKRLKKTSAEFESKPSLRSPTDCATLELNHWRLIGNQPGKHIHGSLSYIPLVVFSAGRLFAQDALWPTADG
ncbi:hypothetical protein C8J57DRAFT_1249140 [Mycena rebaudengoi]|nr:hypothetical protein C8J57DRAFT_1249140 [Mycena rebaudengoi]